MIILCPITNATAQPITSDSPLRKNVLVVIVESFYEAPVEKLRLKVEGNRVGFHRKIREPAIERSGLALAGFTTISPEMRPGAGCGQPLYRASRDREWKFAPSRDK